MRAAISSWWARTRADPSWAAFLAFAFFAGCDSSAARAAALVCGVLSLASPARRRALRWTGPAVGALLFFAVAAGVSLALRETLDDPLLVPERGLGKLTKLLWYAAIPLGVAQVDTRSRLLVALHVFVTGALVLAVATLFVNPLLAWVQLAFPTDAQVAAGVAEGAGRALHDIVARFGSVASVNRWIYAFGRAETFPEALAKVGSFPAAERFAAALPAALCLFFETRSLPAAGPSGEAARRRATLLAAVTCALLAAALLLVGKKGPLLASGVVSAGLLLTRLSPRRAALAVALAVAVSACAPTVRARFAALPDEWTVARGGRALMWTRLVPALHAEHPWGVGFRALTWEKLFSIDRRTELSQDHVHSTPLQTFVELGWPGFVAWALWMVLCFRAVERLACLARRPSAGDCLPESLAFAAPMACFLAVFLCGTAETNLSDAAAVLLVSFAVGLPGPSLLRSAPVAES